eukprot:COSAG01_NODE_164_length_23340_cov_76.030033_21_plen_70_part_00
MFRWHIILSIPIARFHRIIARSISLSPQPHRGEPPSQSHKHRRERQHNGGDCLIPVQNDYISAYKARNT